jgi:hypothetical protein
MPLRRISTFRCDGCGQRFPATQLYRARDISCACSAACDARARDQHNAREMEAMLASLRAWTTRQEAPA